jgi:3-methylcrotonyl-CoA carboxylase alpha subunit
MIKKILIANRGEIACRVIRSARKLGICTVAVYSEVDAKAMHVQMADEAVCLGEASASKSYLNADLVLKKAKALGVDAIHPGYGFLSENANFADKCEQNDIVFIGPGADAIRAMGSKSAAKTIMQEAKVPLVPGYHGDNQDPELLHQESKKMGYPVLLKAAAGGGGKGMRQVWKDEDFYTELAAAKREAMSSFGDDHMLVEKYLTEPRHVEIQVFCDNHGNGVYLFERDCSVQRRHQKIIEEAPAPNMSEQVRQQMGEAALKAAFAINYRGAGTVEFLLDKDGSFYFMEMNTRLQVEHPVTEFITGEDLVEWQIAVANNLPLPKEQAQLKMRGHAFEARIYAEDPDNEFLPSTGVIEYLHEPTVANVDPGQAVNPNIRIDSGVRSGDEISIYYDPMISKLIVWGENRESALAVLLKSLKSTMLCGLSTNIPYLIRVAQSEAFQNAELTTDFIERHADAIKPKDAGLNQSELLLVSAILSAPVSISKNTAMQGEDLSGFRLNHTWQDSLHFSHLGKDYHQVVSHVGGETWQISDGQEVLNCDIEKTESHIRVDTPSQSIRCRYFENLDSVWVLGQNGMYQIDKVAPDLGDQGIALHAGDLTAPMNGTLVKMQVSENETVQKDQVLAIVEAMKMEHSLRAPFDGTVIECFANEGDRVDGGSVVISLKQTES